jgi:signal transduction histidine kinase
MSTDTICILLVEDDEDDVAITRHLLSQTGQDHFRVQATGLLGDALAQIDEAPPDVVLLDMNLPDSEGWSTLLRMLSHTATIPVILLTGLADEAMGVKAVQTGAQDYLFKGHIDRDGLARSIRYAIERKRSELALKRYRDHLEEMVSERTDSLRNANTRLTEEMEQRKRREEELKTANEQLLAHDRARTEFVSNVSHELKTPLASMSYAIDNLLKGIVGPMPERAMKYMHMLKEDAARLGSTVNDILDMSRIETDTLKLDKVRVPLARLISRTVDSLQLQAKEGGLTLENRTKEALGFAECDPQKIERIVLNVVSNAIKFTPQHGTVIVTLNVDPDNTNLFRLSIIDSGIGIEEDYIDKVTERYFRVGEHVDGTGLGLAICKDIVALHGGRLDIVSPPPGHNTGTQVDIQIPRSTPPRVLVVDDCLDTCRLLTAQLQTQEYTVDYCENGAEALVQLEQTTPDIILTDLVMPALDGVTLIAEIKARPEWRHIPVIAITGGEIDRVKREVLEGFAIPALAKPWQQDDLLDLIETTVFGMRYLEGGAQRRPTE